MGISQNPIHNLTVNVLGLREDGKWVAVALEMDLRGYGETFDKALEDLKEQMAMQISFASFKGDMSMAFHDAEPHYWSMHARAKMDHLKNYLHSDFVDSDYQVGGVDVPPAHIINQLKEGFAAANG